MTTYMIGYDLLTPGQDYSDLHEAIKKLGAWWHCLDSTWLLNTNLTAAQIRDSLIPYLDRNDRLLVSTITRDAAWIGFDQGCSDWLKDNL